MPRPRREALANKETEAAGRPKDVKVQTALAEALFATGNRTRAVKVAKRVVALDPKNVRALELIGRAAFGIGDDEEASEHLERAFALAPARFWTRKARGELRWRRRKAKAAIREIEAARRIYPRFVEGEKSPYALLVHLYDETKQPEKVIACFATSPP